MVLFNMCSAVTVEWCLLCSSLVSAITESMDMGLYAVPLFMALLGFGMGIMLANFHMCGIVLVLRAVFNMLVRNASPRGPMCFKCLMFSLCQDLVSGYVTDGRFFILINRQKTLQIFT